MSESFPGPKSLGRKVKVELDLSNYATKTDLKNARGVDTSSFTKKTHLAYLKTDWSSLKSKVDKLDVDKLLPASVDLSKLSDVVNNNVVKKDVCNVKMKNIEDKMPDITNLPTKASLNAKPKDVKSELPSITNLATIASLMLK